MEGNSIVLFENLCNIFEMRIKLDKEKGVMSSLDVLSNYEKYAKKIDSVYNSEFQKDLKPFMSPAVTLEKEKDRLRRLIKLLEDRLDRRIELEDRYYNTTGKYITGLQMIVSEEELEDKKERLSLVSRYLETSEEIENVTESISELKKLLKEEEEKKEQYESKNSIMEDELYSAFMNTIKDIDYYKNISEEKIANELDMISMAVSEAKETLDITKDSVGSLITNGLEDDYASYVEEAERNYYSYKNKEIILTIYKLVSSFEDDFKLICAKRENINDLLIEKNKLSDELVINVENELTNFENVVLTQIDTLNNEREVLDNINNYTSRIKFKEERLEELNESNNSVEILSLLREYGIIETYDTEDALLDEEVEVPSVDIPTLEEEYNDSKIELPSLEELVKSDDSDDVIVEELYDPYRIVDVTDYPITLNVGLARLKGESVREKVNKKLNPKKEEKEPIKEDIIDKTIADVEVVPAIEVEENVPATESKNEEDIEKKEIVTEEKIVEEVKEEPTLDMPVWELPTMVDASQVADEPKSIVSEEPVVNSLPVWEAITPVFEETTTKEENKVEIEDNVIDLNINSNLENNMFWIPVSSEKVDNNGFPTINANNNNNLNNSGFIFPTINN